MKDAHSKLQATQNDGHYVSRKVQSCNKVMGVQWNTYVTLVVTPAPL